MNKEKERAIRLVAAAESFSEGTALVVLRELRALLENDSVAVVSVGSAEESSQLEGLRAENERLREELARAKDALRQREKRSRGKTPEAPPIVDDRQEPLFASDDATGRDGRPSGRESVRTDARPSSNSSESIEASSGTACADLDLSTDLSLKRDQRSGRRRTSENVVLDAERPTDDFLELAAEARPDLSEHVRRRSFRRFVEKNPKGWESEASALRHWRFWLRREDVSKTTPFQKQEPPPESATRTASVEVDEDPPYTVPSAEATVAAQRRAQKALCEAFTEGPGPRQVDFARELLGALSAPARGCGPPVHDAAAE